MNEDRSTKYHRLRRRASMLSMAWSLALLVALLGSGASEWMRDFAQRFAAGVLPTPLVPFAVVMVYVLLLLAVHEIGRLPIDFYRGFALEQRYGLSNQELSAWVRDQIKGLIVAVVVAIVAASILYACIRQWPAVWWLPCGVIFAAIVVGLANLGPVLLLPLFYSVKPLEHESLRRRLLALADRAGARVVGAYEWGLAAETKKANAALTGLGATRRILISDTMLAEYSEDEIEVVLAHELAHHVHGDIWKGLIFESGLILAGLFVASRVMNAIAPSLGVEGGADVAGLPLLLLALTLVSLALLPAAHAMSRAYERKADRFALTMTRNPAAFISAMKRLGAQSLAEEHPSTIVQWLFYSHPPMRERIEAAKNFAA